MSLGGIFDSLQPQADATAVSATNAALDAAAARPYNVVLSVAPDTQRWVALLLLGGLIAGLVLKR